MHPAPVSPLAAAAARLPAVLAAGLLLGASLLANAAPVRLTVLGTADNSTSNGLVQTGNSVAFSFVFDSALGTTDSAPSSVLGRFENLVSSELSIDGGRLRFGTQGTGTTAQLLTDVPTGINAFWAMTSGQDLSDLPAELLAFDFQLYFTLSGAARPAPFADPNIYMDVRTLMQTQLSAFDAHVGILHFLNQGRPGENATVTLDLSTLRLEDLNTVPEPGTLALAVVALAALQRARRPRA